MTTPMRFPYTAAEPERPTASLLPYLPIVLSHKDRSLAASGLLDTGSTVNVLPYTAGLELGLEWEQQTIPVHLTGTLAGVPARGVIVVGQVESLPPVQLVFAWTRSAETPVILGQVNFFMEFDVCFFRSQKAFEIKLRGK